MHRQHRPPGLRQNADKRGGSSLSQTFLRAVVDGGIGRLGNSFFHQIVRAVRFSRCYCQGDSIELLGDFGSNMVQSSAAELRGLELFRLPDSARAASAAVVDLYGFAKHCALTKHTGSILRGDAPSKAPALAQLQNSDNPSRGNPNRVTLFMP